MDNLGVHHYDGGQILEEYLDDIGVELIFTPTYSPDLNPVELCFGKIKAKLNGELSDAVHENLKLAVMDAVEKIHFLCMRNDLFRTLSTYRLIYKR